MNYNKTKVFIYVYIYIYRFKYDETLCYLVSHHFKVQHEIKKKGFYLKVILIFLIGGVGIIHETCP